MNSLLQQILNATSIDEWLTTHGLGWMIGDRFIELISIILGAIIAYYVGRILIVKGVQHAIRSAAKHRSWHRKDMEKREETLVELMKSFWRILMIAYVAAMVANKAFGFDLSPLFASAGIIGVAIGFGSQSLVKDFLTGIFIIAENQYRVGDIVDIMGSVGKVERVGTRSTVVRDNDGNVHYIPNGTIQRVINKTMGYGMARFIVNVDLDTDVTKATKIINGIGLKLSKEAAWKKKIIEPPQFVTVGDVTGQSVELIVSGKTMPSDQWSVTAEMRSRILEAFELSGVSLQGLPSPTNKK
jgi:small conductance mechanosensitive channel